MFPVALVTTCHSQDGYTPQSFTAGDVNRLFTLSAKRPLPPKEGWELRTHVCCLGGCFGAVGLWSGWLFSFFFILIYTINLLLQWRKRDQIRVKCQRTLPRVLYSPCSTIKVSVKSAYKLYCFIGEDHTDSETVGSNLITVLINLLRGSDKWLVSLFHELHKSKTCECGNWFGNGAKEQMGWRRQSWSIVIKCIR